MMISQYLRINLRSKDDMQDGLRVDQKEAEREKFKMKRRRLAAECECSSGAVPPPNKTRKMDHPDASDVKVVVDCGYDKLMNILDIKKLVKQIQRCYAENRRVEKPLQYYVCNFKDKTKNVFDTSIQGYKQWDVYFEGLDPEAKFGKENLVFLAAESPNILENIDPKKVYIIGGLVDHNHHKGVCFQNAVDKGWEHAQLPLGNNVQLKSRKVLTVNHVFEIMLQFVQCNSWQETISKVIPLRKQLTDCKTDNKMTENSEEKLDGNEQNENCIKTDENDKIKIKKEVKTEDSQSQDDSEVLISKNILSADALLDAKDQKCMNLKDEMTNISDKQSAYSVSQEVKEEKKTEDDS
ncbi:tRNA methyltransferase 10 homolog A-like isoform X2 [Antedon mediterranea]|uniref:tRNA methyltransferase 10 homolog A-like isoform X2 n=1 Tax=Antedon mediterranea TaxID=105859 RepID=UPI003AF65C09